MGALLGTWHLVDAPAVVPHPYGLFSVAEPRLSTDEHWRIGVQWQSQACIIPKQTTGPCIGEPAPLTEDDLCSIKEFEPFTVYVYDNDPVVGHTLEQHRANATARLVNGEQTAVEQKFWDDLNASPDFSYNALSVSAITALGALEHQLAKRYPGTGIIHMSRAAATTLWENLVITGGRAYTALGTPVVIGGGYDYANPADVPVQTAIFGTGPVVMYRGDIDTREEAFNKPVNEVSYIAQRDYVLAWDCVSIKVTTKLDTPLT